MKDGYMLGCVKIEEKLRKVIGGCVVGMLTNFEGDGMAPTQLSPLLTECEPHSCIQFTTSLLFFNTCPHFHTHRNL